MFSFFRRFTPLPGYHMLETDLHSHLLPGIDDGSPNLEESVALVRALKSLGYRRLITTPHIHAGYYPNTPAIIRKKLQELRKALRKQKIDIRLDAAAEYFVDDFFCELLEQKAELLTLPGNRVLIEMSFLAPDPRIRDVVFRLNTLGYRPILAHPERYGYYHNHFAVLEELRNAGCALQLNLLALTGHYGPAVRKQAERLLEADMADYLGTDLHHRQHATDLKALLADRKAATLLTRHTFKNAEL